MAPRTWSPVRAPLQPSATPWPGSSVPVSPGHQQRCQGGWEGKLRHEAGRSEATQGAGSRAQRRLHAQFIFFKVIFFPCRNCPASHPAPPRQGCPRLELSHSFSERCQQGCSPRCRSSSR